DGHDGGRARIWLATPRPLAAPRARPRAPHRVRAVRAAAAPLRRATMTLHGMLWPRTVEEATALLAEDPDAKPIAGGATLVAMMNARVIEPQALRNPRTMRQ